MSKSFDKLKKIVQEAVLAELDSSKERGMYEFIVDITKAASAGLKSIQGLKSKQMPTVKSQNAVEASLAALEMIFMDMSMNPAAYLDTDPGELVGAQVSKLDSRQSILDDGSTRSEF